jgi:hypothetical protein
MSGCLRCLVVVLAASLGEPEVVAHAAKVSSAPKKELMQRGLNGLVALPDRTVVSWGHGGIIRMRRPDGSWSSVVRLDLDSIRQVVPDLAGALVFGWKGNDSNGEISRSVVLLVSPRGGLLEQWKTDDLLSIASRNGRRWATAWPSRPHRVPEGINLEKEPKAVISPLLELMLGGKVEPRGWVEIEAQIASFDGGSNGISRVDCIPRSETMEPFYPAYCAAAGSGGWRKIGSWNEPPPFSCGRYLVEMDDGESHGGAPRRGNEAEVVIRRLDNGEIAGQRRLPRDQAVACGSPGELLLAGAAVEGWSLPELAQLWRVPMRHGRVVAVVRVGDEVLAATAAGTIARISQAPVGLAADVGH